MTAVQQRKGQRHSEAEGRWGLKRIFPHRSPRAFVPRSYRCILPAEAHPGRFAFSRVHGSSSWLCTHAFPLPVLKLQAGTAPGAPKEEVGCRLCTTALARGHHALSNSKHLLRSKHSPGLRKRACAPRTNGDRPRSGNSAQGPTLPHPATRSPQATTFRRRK